MLDLSNKRAIFQHVVNNPDQMYGYLRGFVNHLERTVPGVQQEIRNEIIRLKQQQFNTEVIKANSKRNR